MRSSVVLDFDGGTHRDVSTGSPILDFWLRQFAYYGQFNLGLQVTSDRPMHCHQLCVEVGLALGHAIRECLEDSRDIRRMASTHAVVEDALMLVAIDLGGRSHFSWDVNPGRETIAEISSQSARELFAALCDEGRMALHVRQESGVNANNVLESVFRGLGRSLHVAAELVDRSGGNGSRR